MSGEIGQNKTLNNFKNRTSLTYFSHLTYCPRSSMDRVTDFESGGCAFDPRRGYRNSERHSLPMLLSVFTEGLPLMLQRKTRNH